MHITISGQQVVVSTTLRDFALHRIDHHFDHVTNGHVVLHVNKNCHQVEATIHARGVQLNATAEATNMYSAIDRAADKLDRQVFKHKEKTGDRQQRGSLKSRARN